MIDDPMPDLSGRMASCSFGMQRLLPLVHAFEKEIDGVRAAKDIEHIHRMRVASRRLRAALPLFSVCFPEKEYSRWIREVRRVTRALGEARDADVQMAFLEKLLADRAGQSKTGSGPEMPLPVEVMLLKRLTKKRHRLQTKVIFALDALEKSRVIHDMTGRIMAIQALGRQVKKKAASAPGAITALAAARIDLSLASLMAFEPWVHNADAVAQHHAMRIAAKKLRYTTEVYAPLYRLGLKKPLAHLKRIQTILGEMHDRDVWIDTVTLMLVAERSGTQTAARLKRQDAGRVSRLKTFLSSREKERRMLHRRFCYLWGSLSRAGLWDELRETLDSGRRKRYRLDTSPADAEIHKSVLVFSRSAPGIMEHSITVTRLALGLFDGLRNLHGMGPRERFMLESAGLLHDIALNGGRKGHARRGEEMILSDERLLLPFHMRGIIAILAGAHRGKFRPGARGFFSLLSDQERTAVRMLASLLRLANALDTARDGRVDSVACKTKARQVIVTLKGTGDLQAPASAAQAISWDFKTVFDRQLIVI